MKRVPVGWGLCSLVGALWLAASCAEGSLGAIPDGSLPAQGDAYVARDGASKAHDARADANDGGSDLEADAGDETGDAGSSDGDAASEDADGGTDGDAGEIADSGRDATLPVDSGKDAKADKGTKTDTFTCPTGTTGPGCSECAANYHLCGSTCTANVANNPSVGCALSCGGGACSAPVGEVASCTDAGTCSASCAPGTILCSDGSCAACCTSSDCPTNVICSGGTCSECVDGYGTCSTLCDTNMTTNSNCGSCGNTCTVNVVLCALLSIDCGCVGYGVAYSYSCS